MAATSEKTAWESVRDALSKRIKLGKFLPSKQLPSEKVLCGEFGVSQITVRRALRELAGEGLIERRQGVGTFVLDREKFSSSAAGNSNGARSPSVLDLGLVFTQNKTLSPETLAPFYLSLFSHLQEELGARGGSLQLLSLPRHTFDTAPLLETAAAKARGSLALVGMLPKAVVQGVAGAGWPVVQVDHASEDSELDAVLLDHRDGARRAVELLYALGHRRFGMIRALKSDPEKAGALVESSGSRERHRGFTEALSALGIEAHPAWEFFGTLGEYDWVPKLEPLLSMDPAPSALLLADPHFVPETVRVAGRMRRPVPERLSLVSFGVPGCLPGFRPSPALATFDAAAFAAALVDRLEARAGGGARGRVIRRIPMHLDPGETIAPPVLPASSGRESAWPDGSR